MDTRVFMVSLAGLIIPTGIDCAPIFYRGAIMSNSVIVYSRFNRNIFTKNTYRNNRDRLDGVVFKVAAICGMLAMMAPWGIDL